MSLKSDFAEPLLSYSSWFFTTDFYYQIVEITFLAYPGTGSTPIDDSLLALLTNGPDTITLETITENHDWRRSPTFDLNELIEVTDEMRIIFRIGDTAESPNFLEAAIDHLQVTEGMPPEPEPVELSYQVFPNPFGSETTVQYQLEEQADELRLLVLNALGQLVEEQQLEAETGELQLGQSYPVGIYFFVFEVDGKRKDTFPVVKGL